MLKWQRNLRISATLRAPVCARDERLNEGSWQFYEAQENNQKQ